MLAIHPTIFYRRVGHELFRAVDIAVREIGNEPARLRYSIGGVEGETELERLDSGTWRGFVPDVRSAAPAEYAITRNGSVIAETTRDWTPGRHWRVVLAPVAHHDYGYTSTIEDVLAQYRGYYRDTLRYVAETDEYPDGAQFHYTAEEAWSLIDFLRTCSDAERDELVARMREGRIELPALLGNEITNLCGHEELVRLLYPSQDVAREHGIPIRTASITDIPGLAWALPTLLAACGVRSFLAGLPTYFEWGDRQYHNFWDESRVMPNGRPGAFWWEGPDGARVLTYYHGGYGVWMPTTTNDVASELPGMLEGLELRDDYPFDAIRAAYDGLDNRPPNRTCCDLAKEWNETWEFPRLEVGTNTTFFAHLHETLDRSDAKLPLIRGELPDTDYVMGALSSARETGLNRVTHSRLGAAERFATVAHLVACSPERRESVAKAWEHVLMFDEHTWGMSTPVGPVQERDWAEKSRHAYAGAGLAADTLTKSLADIAQRIEHIETERTVVVFNPSGRSRTDVVCVDQELSGLDGIELIDVETGDAIPGQIVRNNDPLAPEWYASGKHAMGEICPELGAGLAFVARDVPALGWRSYRLGDATEAAGNAESGSALDTPHYHIEIDERTGAIASLLDKALGRDLCDTDSEHGINQLIVRDVVSGDVDGLSDVRVESQERGPVFSRIVVRGRARGCPEVTQDIRVWHAVKRIDCATRVVADGTPFLEHLIAFPFAFRDPELRAEVSNATLRPVLDQMPGSNTNYYAVQRWIDVAGDDGGAILSCVEPHMAMLGGLKPDYVSQAHHGVTSHDFGAPFDTEPPDTAHVYVPVMLSNFRTNFRPTQHGEAIFRHTITSYDSTFTSERAVAFGSGVHEPLVACAVTSQDDEPALPPLAGFCEVAPETVELVALKTAQNGDGLIARMRETAGRECTVSLHLPMLNAPTVCRTTPTETDVEPVEPWENRVEFSMKPFEIATVRVRYER